MIILDTKVCAKCKVEKPLDEFYYCKSSSTKDKRASYCKSCQLKCNNSYRAYYSNLNKQEKDDMLQSFRALKRDILNYVNR